MYISESLYIPAIWTLPLESVQVGAPLVSLPQCPVSAYLLPPPADSTDFVFLVNILHAAFVQIPARGSWDLDFSHVSNAFGFL